MTDQDRTVPLLEVRDLKKSFEDSGAPIHVLKGINLTIQPEKSLSITGQSGSGKSTLLNAISGIETFDEGRVRWQGRDIQDFRASELTRIRGQFFGFIFQSYYLISELNALENVLIPARMSGRLDSSTKDRAEELMNTVGLQDRIRYNVQKLSGGERQRVAIARALINKPQVILADEPTGNLDESTATEVMDLIFEVTSGDDSALLLVTHNPEYAQLTQSQATLQDGVILEG